MQQPCLGSSIYKPEIFPFSKHTFYQTYAAFSSSNCKFDVCAQLQTLTCWVTQTTSYWSGYLQATRASSPRTQAFRSDATKNYQRKLSIANANQLQDIFNAGHQLFTYGVFESIHTDHQAFIRNRSLRLSTQVISYQHKSFHRYIYSSILRLPHDLSSWIQGRFQYLLLWSN